MDINMRNESNQAEHLRLKETVTDLEGRLSRLEPKPEAPKPDPKAEKAAKKAREDAVSDLRHRLDARQVFTKQIDETVTRLAELIHEERKARHDILKAHGLLIEKETRRVFANDSVLVNSLQRRLGDTLRPHTAHQQPSFTSLGEQLRKMILKHAESTDSIDELLS